MKFFKITLFLLIGLSGINKAKAGSGLPAAFSIITRDYFELQKALAANNSELATEKSQGLIWDLKSIPVKDMNESQHSQWFSYLDKLMRGCRGISQGTSINQQRLSFSNLSADYFDVLKTMGANTVVIYKLFCSQGGNYWLGKSAATPNPYGNKGCVSVKETLKPHTK